MAEPSMIERVARAIQVADGMPMSMALCHARAAIAAMREPTPAMREAGSDEMDIDAKTFGVAEDMAADCWAAMIDAALKGD